MYQANGIGTRREPNHGLARLSANAQSGTARQDGTYRQGLRLRVVRAPGGFAFVEDRPKGGDLEKGIER